MLDPAKIITAINKSLEPFFIKGTGGAFHLTQYRSQHTFRLRISDESSNAFDSYGNGGEYVKVVKWFNDFWLFVEITFQSLNGVIITLSIFQGDEIDPQKVQLFRAEWDDYGDGKTSHAQPHWHLLANRALEETVSSFAEIDPEIKDTFVEVLNDEKDKSIDLSKFHFAMNGDWSNTKIHVHRINEDKILANWFGGLLGYLKNELEFVDNKSSKIKS